MQYYVAFAACVALAAAQSTVPTGPPMGVYRTEVGAAAATATTIFAAATPTAAVAQKRDVTVCVPQPAGIAHATLPDTPDAFLADTYYSNAALSAATPSAYNSVYINNNSSNNADQYMGYTLMDTYDINSCASQCDSISGCNSFNVYFERDPSVDPNDSSCLNPTSVTHVKCVWWGSVLTTTTAVNDGQWRGDFHVLIAGSNAYNKIPVSASSSSTTSSKMVTSTISATASATTSKAAATTTAAATAAPFLIQIGYSGSSLDTKWMSVSSRGAISYVTSKSSASKFVIDAAGNLVSQATGLAVNVASGTGSWQKIAFSSLKSSSPTFASCSLVSPYVMCNVNNAFQFAGVCGNDGSLYFGLPNKMPSNCKWAGLYPTTA